MLRKDAWFKEKKKKRKRPPLTCNKPLKKRNKNLRSFPFFSRKTMASIGEDDAETAAAAAEASRPQPATAELQDAPSKLSSRPASARIGGRETSSEIAAAEEDEGGVDASTSSTTMTTTTTTTAAPQPQPPPPSSSSDPELDRLSAAVTSAQEALQRGAGMAHRGIVYVHMDLRNFNPMRNKATVR